MSENDCECACGAAASASATAEHDKLDELIVRWKGRPGALVPVLQAAQQYYGHLSQETIRRIGEGLGVPVSTVFGVVTFYSFFTRIPRGKYVIRVCLGTACYVQGGDRVLQALKEELGIDVGGTTGDRLFSLEVGRCFGACGLAPVLMVNDAVHQRVKPADVKGLLSHYRTIEAGVPA